MTKKLPFFPVIVLFFVLLSSSSAFAEEQGPTVVDSGDTAWMLTSTVLVLMMTLPGLALFYGGLVRSKNVLSIFVQCFAMAGVMSLIWVIFGYAIAAGEVGNGFWGWKREFVMLGHVTADLPNVAGNAIPESVWITFQMTFIIITPALIVGAFAERMKFSAILIFTVIWTVISYLPMWHMAWGGGFFHQLGAVDFAGGNVVHINAGIAGLVACLFLGKRQGYPAQPIAPHNVTYVLIGAALLWVGWFGFNAGSAGGANGSAGMAMLTTQIAAASAVVVWMGLEWILVKKPTAVGAATGAVAGLVAITPAAGSTTIGGAIVMGAVSSFLGFLMASRVKQALGYDDSLDVFGVHGVGGMVGAVLTGVFVREGASASLVPQLQSVGITVVWSAAASVIALTVAKVTVGLRVAQEVEHAGLDFAEHGEEAYNFEGR